MPKLINVPIELLEERYSAQWNRWFPIEYQKLGVKYIMIYGKPLSNTIRQGSFLDVIGTNHYKAQQLQQLMQMFDYNQIHDNDIILFHDGWFPGLEMLAYVRDALSLKFKIAGIFHAGTYDPMDFLTQKDMWKWGGQLENSWFQIYDYILVNSHFQKNMLWHSRNIDLNKVFVIGYPLYDEFSCIPLCKENIVVFPHRLDPEKQPEFFDSVAKELKVEFPNWQFIKTKDVCKTKKEYYELLNRSKIAVSCALQETFGIAMAEACICDCMPLVPDRLSYLHLYDPIFRYRFDNLKDAIRGAISLIDYQDIKRKIQDQRIYFLRNGAKTIKRTVDICFSMDPSQVTQWKKYPFV